MVKELQTHKKWRNVRVRQELVEEVKREIEKKKNQYPSLSEFVSEAVQLRLQTLEEERIGGPVVSRIRAPKEGQIWNKIADYNRNEDQCEYKEDKISTMLAVLPKSSAACRLTGIQCSKYTCPKS